MCPNMLTKFLAIIIYVIYVFDFSRLKLYTSGEIIISSNNKTVCGTFTAINKYNGSTQDISLYLNDLEGWNEIAKKYRNYQIDFNTLFVRKPWVMQVCPKSNRDCFQVFDESSSNYDDVNNIKDIRTLEYAACFEMEVKNNEQKCENILLPPSVCLRVFYKNNCRIGERTPYSAIRQFKTPITADKFNMTQFSFVYNPNCDFLVKSSSSLYPVKFLKRDQQPDLEPRWCSDNCTFLYTLPFWADGLAGEIQCFCENEVMNFDTSNNQILQSNMITVFAGLFFGLILVLIIIVYLFKRKRGKESFHYQIPPNWTESFCKEISSKRYLIDLKNLLGEGHYGAIYKGHLRKLKTEVAVKVVKKPYTLHNVESLVNELKVMEYVGKHPNVVQLVGVNSANLKKGKLVGLMELCHGGNLDNHLKQIFKETQEWNKCAVQTIAGRQLNAYMGFVRLGNFKSNELEKLHLRFLLLQWCEEICCGMSHLSMLNVIHVDVAARNILLTNNLTAKISDFGLSRKLYDSLEYKKAKNEYVPWKWFSIESLLSNTFSVKSDVWSFGITLWEIFSLCSAEMYPNISNVDELRQFLVCDNRLLRPTFADSKTFKILQDCLDKSPEKRPEFASLTSLFRELQCSTAVELNSLPVSIN